MDRRRQERRNRRGPGSRLGRVSLILSMLGIVVVVVFVVSRVVTDRYEWSQWVWWVPGIWFVMVGWGVLAGSVLAGWLSRRQGSKRRGLVLPGVVLAGCVGMLLNVLLGGLYGNGASGNDWAHGEQAKTVRVMHWNLSAGEIDVERTVAWIDESDVDVVLIANPRWDGQREDLTTGLRLAVGENGTVRRLSRAIVASRFPLVRASMVYLSASGTDGTSEDAIRATGDFGWVAMLRFDGGDEVGEFNVWFVDLPSEPTVHRMESMGRVAELLRESNRQQNPALIIGDFNTVRGSASLGLFDEFANEENGRSGFVDAFGDRGGGLWGGSWKPIKSQGIGRRAVRWTSWGIDLSLVGNGWTVGGYKLTMPDGSVWGQEVSHRAQVVDIER